MVVVEGKAGMLAMCMDLQLLDCVVPSSKPLWLAKLRPCSHTHDAKPNSSLQ